MEPRPTPLQEQIERSVTSGRGYDPCFIEGKRAFGFSKAALSELEIGVQAALLGMDCKAGKIYMADAFREYLGMEMTGREIARLPFPSPFDPMSNEGLLDGFIAECMIYER